MTNSKSDILRGKSLHFTEETDIGEQVSVAKDIDDWTYSESKRTTRKLSKNATMSGTVTTIHNAWHDYMESTKGFYVEDYGVSFTKNIKRRAKKDGEISVTIYWVAQKRVNGVLYRSYVCKLKDLDYTSIVAGCEKLLDKIEGRLQ